MNAKGADQWTALHFAAKSGHVHIIEELLQHQEVDIESQS